MNIKQKLLAYIRSFDLDTRARGVWALFVSFIDDETAQNILNVVQNHDDFKFFTANLISKQEAVKDDDSQIWNAIVEEEKTYLASL